MKEIFETLMPIKESTGLEIDLYSDSGNIMLSTSLEKPEYRYVHHKTADFENGIISDKDRDITYFLVGEGAERITGVIMGSNDVSRNYAVMVSKLIEKTVDASRSVLDKETRFKLLLNGEINALQYEALKSTYANVDFYYYVLSVVVNPAAKREEIKAFLEEMSEREDIIVCTDAKTIVYIKKADDNDEYKSADDFAYILYENIREEIKADIKINVGGAAHSFDDLPVIYKQCLFAFNFGAKLDNTDNVYSYKQYALMKMLSDIPKEDLTQYFGALLDLNMQSVIEDSELMETADAFLKNSLNIAETSRNMYMHRNTLIYRLDKIESAMGLNIRRFNDALIFKLIITLDRLINNR